MDHRVEHLLAQRPAVLATVSPEGKPQAATILFAADEDLNLYFETSQCYRKATNLSINPLAALVVSNENQSLQVEGTVSFLEGKEAAKARQLLLKKNPGLKKWLDKKEELLLKLTPNWLRLRDSEKDEFVQII